MSFDKGLKRYLEEGFALNGFSQEDKFVAYIRYCGLHPNLTDMEMSEVCHRFMDTDYYEDEPGHMECMTDSETSDTEDIPDDAWSLYCNETWGAIESSEKKLG